MSSFNLDTRLEHDCEWVCDLKLCKVLLLKDANYPWLILVPMIANCVEIIDLEPAQQQLLWQESAQVSRALQQLFQPDKLNIAAIGNVVAQLHIHHIVRYSSDLCWPKPVWGQHPAKSYESEQLAKRITQLAQLLQLN
ncbi:MAG: HIT family protein [Paraglaciecola sp.]|uniref:HIT domain-containing protein n=1 Tax=Paraglaciecola sp. TaxID=1920173 RepID=UPI00273F603F|nr:HIT family protein [Paraglaciecola sp.]MDP5031234.1 HIT family protein [Paraglaciecola sp.]MDP5134103.1 HIT family protein [Paraglaciecola sp.]